MCRIKFNEKMKQHCGVANRNVDIDLEGSITGVSKMLQADRAVSQRFMNLAGGVGSSTCIIKSCEDEICLKNFFEGGTDSIKDVKHENAEILYYKR